MTIAQPAQTFLNATPSEPLDFLSVTELRALMRNLSDLNYLRFGARPDPVAGVEDYAIPVAGGMITVRAYRPSQQRPLPAHLVLHGGGWWLGSIDERVNEAICRYRCVRAGCVVFAVEYRLAPEFRFPTAIGDCYAVLEWVAEQSGRLGIDPDNISIGGTSAGGNLAAAVAMHARDVGGPRLVFQLLEVPGLDLTAESARAELAAPELAPVTRQAEELAVAARLYLGDPAQARLPLASPVLATDLAGLPPAHIMTAELDPLRAEGERYAERLAAAGVPATAVRLPGAIHASTFLTRVWQVARDWQRTAAEAVRVAHRPIDTPLMPRVLDTNAYG